MVDLEDHRLMIINDTCKWDAGLPENTLLMTDEIGGERPLLAAAPEYPTAGPAPAARLAAPDDAE